MKIVEILKERKETNEYGIMTVKRLSKQYKKYQEREYDVVYVYEDYLEDTNTNKRMCGGCYREFKKLANAEKYCENDFR